MCTAFTETSGSGISCSLWSVFRSQIWITPLWSPTISSAWKHTILLTYEHFKANCIRIGLNGKDNCIINLQSSLAWFGCRQTQLMGALTWNNFWHWRFLDLCVKKSLHFKGKKTRYVTTTRFLGSTWGPIYEPSSPLPLCTSSVHLHGSPQM